jgi:hypothetical protein
LEKGLKGPIKDSEMQKIADHYLKNNKATGAGLFPSRNHQDDATGTIKGNTTMAE